MRSKEREFRMVVNAIVKAGRYPDRAAIRAIWAPRATYRRSGLTDRQIKFRSDEVEAMGYDWDASRKAKRLISRTSR